MVKQIDCMNMSHPLLSLRTLLFPIIVVVFTLSWGACSTPSSGEHSLPGDTVHMRHSSLLTIVECDGYTVVDVKNPWSGRRFKRYVLVSKEEQLPETAPSGTLVRVPLDNVLLFSGVHALLLEELGVIDAVGGVCDAQYMYCDAVSSRLQSGAVTDCGSSLNINSELVMQVNPEAVFVLPYENGGYGKLEKMKYPLVECADYMESSPLGCAEWVRFYGRLMGKAAAADSIFSAVCAEYESLEAIAAKGNERPKLLCELKSSSAWYVPGGASTMGVMYNAAGADYFLSSNRSSGSVPLSFEYVLANASDADIWLIKYNRDSDITLASLKADFYGYSHLKPFVTGEVYGCNTHRKNVFEQTSFHPERLLKELIALFHPGLLPGYKTLYYEKLH